MSKKFVCFRLIAIFTLSSFSLCLCAMEYTAEPVGWYSLPAEAKMHVLSFLPGKNNKIKELIGKKLVNKEWRSLIDALPLARVREYYNDAKALQVAAFIRDFHKNGQLLKNSQDRTIIYDIFFLAISAADEEVVEALLATQIDGQSQEFKEALAAHPDSLNEALQLGSKNVAALLINLGIDTNYKQPCNTARIALEIACAKNFVEIVELLIAKGANVDACNKPYGIEVMRLGAFGQIIASKPDAIACDKYYETALMTAVSFGHEQVVSFLLTHGAEVNLKDILGRSALTIAANGHTKIAEILIKHGATIDSKDRAGRTPLMWAALLGHIDIVELLIGSGANVTICDRKEKTAAMLAAEHGQQEIADFLMTIS